MNALDNLDPMELNALFEKILNAPSFEDKQKKAREREKQKRIFSTSIILQRKLNVSFFNKQHRGRKPPTK